jgi:cytochrome P450
MKKRRIEKVHFRSLCRFLPTKLNKRMKANAREVEELLKGIITKRERATKEGLNNDDLLVLLLESNTKESQVSGSAGPMMTTEDIIGELKLFYFAGMETTAVLLTWTMVVLSIHPEWQDHAREEVLRVFGKNQPDSEGIYQLKTVSTKNNKTWYCVIFSFKSQL